MRSSELRYNGTDGHRIIESSQDQRDDVTLTVSVADEAGEIRIGNQALGVSGGASAWPLPVNLQRGEQFLDSEVVDHAPALTPLGVEVPSGLRLVWFECEPMSDAPEDSGRIERQLADCLSQTAEARFIADALDWEIEVVRYLPGNHSASPAYPAAIGLDPDVIVAAGGLAGQWTDLTVAALRENGVVIVNNGMDTLVAPDALDLDSLSYVAPVGYFPGAPLLETWIAVNGGYQAQTGVGETGTFWRICAGCDVFPVRANNCWPDCPEDWLDQSLSDFFARHIDVGYLGIDWDDVVPTEIAERLGIIPPVLVGDQTAFEAAELTPAGNHAWWAIDTALRELTGEGTQLLEYSFAPRYLTHDGERPQVHPQFREAFLNAWGVG